MYLYLSNSTFTSWDYTTKVEKQSNLSMYIQDIPVWVVAIATIIIVLLFIEFGYKMGFSVVKRIEAEKESPVSIISGAILGLLSFMLAFIFGILFNRYEARKELVRSESLAIRKVWLRSDFLQEPYRGKAVNLLNEYIDLRVSSIESGDKDMILKAVKKSELIHVELWNIAVVSSRKDFYSNVDALFIESLNGIIDIHDMRVARGVQSRTPTGLWIGLYAILFLGMFSIGYQTAIVHSKRSLSTVILALAFSVMFIILAYLDHPNDGFFKVSQQPLINLQATMSARELPPGK
ncbi:DUF4239 domain-containing protein [Flavihumibacter fluvii]|uniref:bestrophin-like domain n=1 Tax=Flavihumibacter fluvii TaxID=2838157 RepID=UPI001BDE221E|nr:DUF4239 domain-containing protein [Flavihumibacter fluvii]ULQ54110.1 DUF4239 domain-containing protein [Flavihumibacter fluvii]